MYGYIKDNEKTYIVLEQLNKVSSTNIRVENSCCIMSVYIWILKVS